MTTVCAGGRGQRKNLRSRFRLCSVLHTYTTHVIIAAAATCHSLAHKPATRKSFHTCAVSVTNQASKLDRRPPRDRFRCKLTSSVFLYFTNFALFLPRFHMCCMTCEAVSDRGDCHVMVLAARVHGVESRYVALRHRMCKWRTSAWVVLL